MLQWWSETDIKILKELYPKSPQENILKALNNGNSPKSWLAIRKKASILKIKRKVKFNKGGRPPKKNKKFLGKKQLSAQLQKDLTVAEIAEKLRSTPDIVRKYIHKYEL